MLLHLRVLEAMITLEETFYPDGAFFDGAKIMQPLRNILLDTFERSLPSDFASSGKFNKKEAKRFGDHLIEKALKASLEENHVVPHLHAKAKELKIRIGNAEVANSKFYFRSQLFFSNCNSTLNSLSINLPRISYS